MENENNELQDIPLIHLYEFMCSKCDVIMQIQIGRELTGAMACICGERMMFSFHSEMQEPVFGEAIDIPDDIEGIE
jgi:hypothetical protein